MIKNIGTIILLFFAHILSAQELFVRIDLDNQGTGGGSPGKGSGWGILSADRKTFTYHMTVNKLQGTISAAHFHFAGTGGVVQGITFTGNTASGSWTNIADTMANHFVDGMLYVNVHTSANAGGEIRGELSVEMSGFAFSLDGTQAGTSSGGKGSGYAVFERDSTTSLGVNTLAYAFTYAGLRGNITAAHFHFLPSGGVLQAVTFTDSTAKGRWSNIPDSVIALFLQKKVYLNIHTSNTPGGEIRGDVSTMIGEAAFAGVLDGAQAGTASTAKGTVWAIYRANNSVTYKATYAKLQGTFSAAHFHTSAGGGVVHGVTFNGNHLSGTWSNLTAANMQDLFKGRIYLNVHSSTAAGGEIRANMKSIPGLFTAELNGSSAGTSSTAKGTAWIDVSGDSAYYHATIAGLQGNFSAAHFHVLPGGGVVKGVTFTDSTTSGWWTLNNSIYDLLGGRIYLNVHSSTAAGGEIRGDFKLGSGITTSVRQVTDRIPQRFSLEQNYPNPFNPATTINYSLRSSGAVTMIVYNLLGQKIATLADGFQTAGEYSATFNAASLASGMYLYQLSVDGTVVSTKKMMLLK